MAPFQTSVSVRQENADLGQDMIDVQILPEEDNWAETTTAITGNTSDRSESIDGVDQWLDDGPYSKITISRYINFIISGTVYATAFASPLLMVILPKLGLLPDLLMLMPIQQKLMYSSCNVECKGHLVALIFKETLLGITTWAVNFRSRKVITPRICIFNTGVIILTILSVCSYWLFYIVQVWESAKTAVIGDVVEYKHLVNYADSLINILLFIHVTAVILIEIRQFRPLYYLKVIRSPDGESHSYAIGNLTIQQAAAWILEKYYTEFSIYNPYLERLPVSKSNKNKNCNFKFYDVDNTFNNTESSNRSVYESDRTILTTQARRRDSSHNERFYEEYEYDRRVKKRKARLITATEEAFAHIQRVNSDTRLTSNPLNPMEAAQSVFPSMARALQKYLRITRQQPRHSVDTILKRLAYCIAQDASPRAFLEPFFNTSPVLANEKEQQNFLQWALVCEGELPSRLLTDNCTFQLRQGEIILLCSVHRLPNFYITEQIALPKSNRFLLKLNSETTV